MALSQEPAKICRIASEPPEEEGIPSFEQLAGGAKLRDTYGRVHPSGLPPEGRPGPMRVYGRNPAEKWLADLSDTNPALREALYHRLKELRGKDYMNAVQEAYINNVYKGGGPAPEEPYDFSQIFKE